MGAGAQLLRRLDQNVGAKIMFPSWSSGVEDLTAAAPSSLASPMEGRYQRPRGHKHQQIDECTSTKGN